jgi:hypothetical protein
MRFRWLRVLRKVFAVATVASFLITVNVAIAQDDTIHVSKTGSPDPDGSQAKPYQMVEAGIARTLTSPDNTVEIGAGTYYETFTTNTPAVLQAVGGTVTIGKRDYQAATSLEIVTLNTHLAGDELFFRITGNTWEDYARADDIADFFGSFSPSPDVVAFQEIWDEDLFFGDGSANGILPRSGYPYGDHGQEEEDILNSGAALMSKFPLVGFEQVQFDEEGGFFDPELHAAKGWVHATIVKDGFSIGLFNLHTHAEDVVIRSEQIAQLKIAVLLYRAMNPSSVVFAVGDYNVYGEGNEYNSILIPHLGLSGLDGHDADRNSPGFDFDSKAQWTLSRDNPLAIYFDDATVSGRLDYIFYFPSLDGTVEVIPLSVDVLQFTGRTLGGTTVECVSPDFFGCIEKPHCCSPACRLFPDCLRVNGLTTDQSSDHWGLHGRFRLVRQ